MLTVIFSLILTAGFIYWGIQYLNHIVTVKPEFTDNDLDKEFDIAPDEAPEPPQIAPPQMLN